MSETSEAIGVSVIRDPSLELRPSMGRTWRGIWNLTWKSQLNLARLPTILLVVFSMPVLIYCSVRSGNGEDFLLMAIQINLSLVVPFSCLHSFGSMIRDELQADTLGFLISRPMTRFRLILCKYLSQVLWLQILLTVNGAAVLLVGGFQEIPDILGIAGWYFLIQTVVIFTWGAMGTLMGLLSKNYLVLGFLYGSLVEFGLRQIPTNIKSLSLTHHIQKILAGNTSIGDSFSWDPEGALKSYFILWAVAAGALLISCFVFSLREYLPSDESSKK
ncbi:MAG TPA: hypothetical protein EYQ50_00120 [Verrucomicrobiales bacterium]|nr:hypothetical protein [Verrucomicrobiales bacterium]HIL71633.1 hypothetical protein [Verrucomicrobiota bacterium]